jgi:hypothetical protein
MSELEQPETTSEVLEYGRMEGCQSTNHTDCYGEMWQCATCGKTVCCAEGTDHDAQLCDDCWAEKYVRGPRNTYLRMTCRSDRSGGKPDECLQA